MPAMAKSGANYMNSQLIKMEALLNGFAEGIALDEPLETAANRVHQNPTPKQAAAGNYKMGRISFHGIPITIENVKGTKRREGWPPLAARTSGPWHRRGTQCEATSFQFIP